MYPPGNANPATIGQINKLVTLGHDRDAVQNVTAFEAGALIRAGTVGKSEAAEYAWKKNPSASGVVIRVPASIPATL